MANKIGQGLSRKQNNFIKISANLGSATQREKSFVLTGKEVNRGKKR